MLAREQARAAMTDARGTPDGRDGHCGGHDAAPARLSVTPPRDALRLPTKAAPAAPAALPPCRPARQRPRDALRVSRRDRCRLV